MQHRNLIRAVIVSSVILSNPCSAGDAHLHPLEEFTITYAHEGMMSGESTQQCRNWCNEMVTTENLVTSMMGISQTTSQKTNIVRDKIYNQNLSTGAVTVTTNPMYQSMVNAWEQNPDPMAFAESWLNALGYQPTGNSRTIAGETCNDYSSPQLMGSTACITDDGLTLRMEMSMGPQMSSTQTATEVNRNDPGDASAYDIPEGAQPVTIPGVGNNVDMQQLQQMLQNMQVPSQ